MHSFSATGVTRPTRKPRPCPMASPHAPSTTCAHLGIPSFGAPCQGKHITFQALPARKSPSSSCSSELQSSRMRHWVRTPTRCDAALRFGSSPQAERCDELAFYAGKSAMLAGLRLRAKEALAILRDPINGLEKSPFTDRLVKIIDAGLPSR